MPPEQYCAKTVISCDDGYVWHLPKGLTVSDLFCDGGCIYSNPSAHGGVYAWCLVENNEITKEGNGVILPSEIGLPTVTNNVAELYAALAGLGEMEKGWRGTLWTDSKVTLFRLGSSQALTAVPPKMRSRCVEIRRARRWQVRLVKGHPTRAMLAQGHATYKRAKVPVSKWNVYCDEKCQQLAIDFLLAKDNGLGI